MDEGGYWRLIDDLWQQADGGAVCAALGRGEVPAVAELEGGFGEVHAGVRARLDALPLDEARDAIVQHRAAVRTLDRDRVQWVGGAWMYDANDDAVPVVPLLGEGFCRRVAADPDAAAVLEPARGLGALGGWHAFAGPVRERWRAALHAAIPARFDDVPYPGDADVSSGDWATTEECRYFCGKDWRTLDRGALYRRYADLSFFAPAGLHYLLPAFLLAALEDVDGSKVRGISILESLLFKLSHGYMRRCIPLLSAGQREVLADTLRLEYERWQYGPFADPDPDLALALDQLDPSQRAPRRPHKNRRR